MKRTIVLILILAFVFTSLALYIKRDSQQIVLLENNRVIKIPEKIIVYKAGKKVVFTKNIDVFDKLYNTLNKRLGSILVTVQLAVNPELEEEIKNNQMVIEFIYTRQQKSIFQSERLFTIEKSYKRLMFPITGDYKSVVFFGDDKLYHSGPLGELFKPMEVKNLLREN